MNAMKEHQDVLRYVTTLMEVTYAAVDLGIN